MRRKNSQAPEIVLNILTVSELVFTKLNIILTVLGSNQFPLVKTKRITFVLEFVLQILFPVGQYVTDFRSVKYDAEFDHLKLKEPMRASSTLFATASMLCVTFQFSFYVLFVAILIYIYMYV